MAANIGHGYSDPPREYHRRSHRQHNSAPAFCVLRELTGEGANWSPVTSTVFARQQARESGGPFGSRRRWGRAWLNGPEPAPDLRHAILNGPMKPFYPA